MCHLDYPRCENLNRWRSVDAHFQDGPGSVSILPLTIKKANTSVMTICNQSPLRLPTMPGQKSFTLCWPSFPGWGRERVSQFLDYKGGQYIQKGHQRTMVNILQFTVGYFNATINWTTRNVEPEIDPDRSSQTERNQEIDRYGAGFGPWRSSGSGVWIGLDCNPPIFLVQTRVAGRFPGPVANTLRMLA